jgi:hypothetical protein
MSIWELYDQILDSNQRMAFVKSSFDHLAFVTEICWKAYKGKQTQVTHIQPWPALWRLMLALKNGNNASNLRHFPILEIVID